MTRERSNATTTITSQTQQPLVGQCEQCGGDVAIITPEYAVAVLRFPPDRLFGLLESGQLHLVKKLICCGPVPVASVKKASANRVEEGK